VYLGGFPYTFQEIVEGVCLSDSGWPILEGMLTSSRQKEPEKSSVVERKLDADGWEQIPAELLPVLNGCFGLL